MIDSKEATVDMNVLCSVEVCRDVTSLKSGPGQRKGISRFLDGIGVGRESDDARYF